MIYRDTTAIEAVNNGADTPDAFYHKSTLMATSKWHSTDGWRGYYRVTPEPGFISIADDWVTGDWDDAIAAEHGETPTEAKLQALEKQYHDIYVIYMPTSNVFSTGYNVLARDPDYQPTKADKGKLIAKATRRWDKPDGSFSVRYHATTVIAYDAASDTYTLDTGGWNTLTTSKRMTDALPGGWYTYRKDWVMYVHTPRGDMQLIDGMTVKGEA